MAAPRATVPPWHLWGTAVLHEQDATVLPAAQVTIGTQQLVNVRYGRPETWHWFFAAEIIAASDIPNALDSAVATVRFDVNLGLGRANFPIARRAGSGIDGIASFEQFAFAWGVPLSGSQSAPTNLQVYSTQAVGPNRDQGAAGLAAPIANPITQLVAETITVQAKIIYNRSAGAGADRLRMNIAAFFAPAVHVRPDWYLDVEKHDETEQFPGGEVPGR